MRSIGTPSRSARLALAAVAASALLAGCAGGKGTVEGAAASVPRGNVEDAGAQAPAPATGAKARAKPAPATTHPPKRPAKTSPAGSSAGRHVPPTDRVRHPAPKQIPKPAPRPAPKPAPTPASKPTTPATGVSAAEAAVLALVNKERASAGCGTLRSNSLLVRVARAHSKDMAVRGYFDHDSQDGRSPFDRMRAAGYKGNLMGENIAAGQPTAASVMTAWMHSPGHRANILNCGYRVIGIGVYTRSGSPYRIYWTQDFGDR
jgi:uncharacterized protein YkwD